MTGQLEDRLRKGFDGIPRWSSIRFREVDHGEEESEGEEGRQEKGRSGAQEVEINDVGEESGAEEVGQEVREKGRAQAQGAGAEAGRRAGSRPDASGGTRSRSVLAAALGLRQQQR